MVVDIDDIETVAVIGAGQMGRGIAAVAALAGYDVSLYDVDADQLDHAFDRIEWSYGKRVDAGDNTADETAAALERIATATDLPTAVTDAEFVTEAAVEQQAVKNDIFADLDAAAPEEAILATNTSGLSITELAEVTDRPGQVIGTHWFNPPMLMELVEVIMTEHTPESVADTAETLVDSFGKTSIRVRTDIAKFVVNRLMRAFSEAPAWMVSRGEHTIEEIDSAMKYKAGFPMGPFELADYTGSIQIRVEAEPSLLSDDRPLSFESEISPIVHQLYDKGRYGRKTGAGYYEYDDADESPTISVDAGQGFDTLLVWAPIVNEAAKLVQHDVATVEDVDTGARLGGNWPDGPLEKADEVGADAILRALTDVASRHEDTTLVAETLPCDLLVRTATNGETFY